MQAVAARSVVVCQAGQAKAQKAAAPVSVVRPLKALGAGVASLALALSANAATVSFAGLGSAGRVGLRSCPSRRPHLLPMISLSCAGEAGR